MRFLSLKLALAIWTLAWTSMSASVSASNESSSESSSSASTTTSSTTASSSWMNAGGPAYGIANAPDFDMEWILKDPSVKFFDAYSRPIKTLYSQVHWINHGEMPIPQDVVDHYNNNNDYGDDTKSDTMAVVGYEVDQVMVDATTGEEVSVPITWAYNHHYMAFLQGHTQDGTKTTLQQRPVTEEMKRQGLVHGTAETMWFPGVENNNQDPSGSSWLREGDRSWSFFSEGNGGEMRKSYHSYPKGYAQLIRKPHSYVIEPMQIDTWNRETMAHTSRFVPPTGNPEEYFPKSASRRIIQNLTQANYNPLLECPCTDRLAKTYTMSYKLRQAQKGLVTDNDQETTTVLDNSTECFRAAEMMLPSTHVTKTVQPGDQPHGVCEAVVRADGSVEVAWKTKQKKPTSGSEASSFALRRGTRREVGVSSKSHSKTAAVADSSDALVGSTPFGSLVNATVVLNTTSQMVEITLKGPYLDSQGSEEEVDRWFSIGLGSSSMCLQMEADECPKGGPYAIVVLPASFSDSHQSTVQERKLEYHGAGKILSSTVDNNDYALQVISNEMEYEYYEANQEYKEWLEASLEHPELPKPAQSGRKGRRRRRVVKLVRPFQGATSDYYSFHPANLQKKALPLIVATGCTGATTFGQHCGHQSPNPMSFARVNQLEEIVRDGIVARIGAKIFQKNCADQPTGDLKHQKNPTCTAPSYQGGLWCCQHGNFLLDAHQSVPWNHQFLEYRLKFRFYYQDYLPEQSSKAVETEEAADTAAAAETSTAIEASAEAARDPPLPKKSAPSHRDLFRFYWTTEAWAGEYDIPECETPSVPSTCVHEITSRWEVSQFAPQDVQGIELIYAAPHCHAPTCLSMDLYNDDTGELLCRVEPVYGKGRNATTIGDSGGGGSSAIAGAEEKYDEAGFLAIPPCLWSHNDEDEGNNVFRPEFLPLNTTLLSIKRCNSTYRHTGEMASWQMRGVLVREDKETSFEESK